MSLKNRRKISMSLEEKLKIAQDPLTSVETLAELSKARSYDVREWVALNPSTSQETLLELTKNRNPKNFQVLHYIVGRSDVSPIVLVELAKFENYELFFKILKHPNTPLEIKKQVDKYLDEELGQDREDYEAELDRPASEILELAKEKAIQEGEEVLETEEVEEQILPKEERAKLPSEISELTKIDPKTQTLLHTYTNEEIWDIASGRKTDVTEEEIEQAKYVISKGIVAGRLSMRKEK